jgi:hypothetical protein
MNKDEDQVELDSGDEEDNYEDDQEDLEDQDEPENKNNQESKGLGFSPAQKSLKNITDQEQ